MSKLLKIIVDGWLIAVVAWFVSQLGVLISFFTYQNVGQFIYLPFYILAYWPSMIISPVGNGTYENAYPLNCIWSFAGWIVLGIIISFSRHLFTFMKTKRIEGSETKL